MRERERRIEAEEILVLIAATKEIELLSEEERVDMSNVLKIADRIAAGDAAERDFEIFDVPLES